MINPVFNSYLKKKKNSKQLTLCYNAKNILITTETAKFYMDHYMEITNISYAIEFTKDKPLNKFIENATKQRIKATYQKNETLQLLYKLTVNSSYGR